MRLLWGMNGTSPGILTKIPKVDLALEGSVVVTLLLGDKRHVPVRGSVWQIDVLTGKIASPVSADTVIARCPTRRSSFGKASSRTSYRVEQYASLRCQRL